MNERIRKLRAQAEKFVLDIPAALEPAEFDEIYEEKFAELIVRECANYAFSDEQDHRAMLKHFGVE